MSTKLSAFMGGLGIDARDKLEVAANATVTVGDGSTNGNVHIGDDGKFIAGAGQDLQIYHDGDNSFIQDAGTGDLVIQATHLRLRSADSETYFLGTADGSVELYHNNIKKFETSAVGVKTTGNVDVTANVGIAGNAVIGTYMSIANTNPAATDALVIGGNVRIASGSLIFADGTSQSSGSTTSTFPTGDYGLLDASNVSTDSFGQTTGGLTQFDMLTSPTGSVDGQDLGALS